jgi:DNA-binding response OmpR family regulator
MDILVVEDEPPVAASLRRAFTRRGHHVEVVSTGEETLRALDDRTYSVVILDWGLPDIDGRELVVKLRKSGRTVPVLMLTGRDTKEDLVSALEAGADDLVAKSNAPTDVLLARAEALFRRSCLPPSPRKFDLGSLVIDEGAQKVLVDGKEIDLPRSEIRVLVTLAANLGGPVSRAEIKATCWGELAEVSDNAIESVMKRIRRKLGKAGDRIRSIRSVGYVLTPQPS